MQKKFEQLEQHLLSIQKWLEEKGKTFEYAEIYEEVSRMEHELMELKERFE